ncbi:hypothetical protein DPMN_011342 [Dreissena polymorpha]|uniref:Uncharacterized protein n=1 Tax=Dreissena polymorpha TaxID=45954 RepID=A0A9D4S050_DREPO|nr:hypothetical protein DPMN_011342 [Dreissena polymorpha]
MASRENSPASWQPYIIETNLLTKFHEDWTINVAFRELTRQMLTPHNAQRDKKRSQKFTMSMLCSVINVASKVAHLSFKQNYLFFAAQDIIKTNILTKFPGEVLTRINYPPLGSHVFQKIDTILDLIPDIIKINVLTKECYRKNVPPPGSHFHDHWTISVSSRVIVFQQTRTIFTNQDIPKTNLLTKFHEDWRKMPRPWRPFFQLTSTIFELFQDITATHLLAKLHEDRTKNVASSVNKANDDAAQCTTDDGQKTTCCTGELKI